MYCVSVWVIDKRAWSAQNKACMIACAWVNACLQGKSSSSAQRDILDWELSKTNKQTKRLLWLCDMSLTLEFPELSLGACCCSNWGRSHLLPARGFPLKRGDPTWRCDHYIQRCSHPYREGGRVKISTEAFYLILIIHTRTYQLAFSLRALVPWRSDKGVRGFFLVIPG